MLKDYKMSLLGKNGLPGMKLGRMTFVGTYQQGQVMDKGEEIDSMSDIMITLQSWVDLRV